VVLPPRALIATRLIANDMQQGFDDHKYDMSGENVRPVPLRYGSKTDLLVEAKSKPIWSLRGKYGRYDGASQSATRGCVRSNGREVKQFGLI
jgi:hypothetical protein